MGDFSQNVRALSQLAFRVRGAAPPRGDLPPFALALFTDEARQPDLPGLLRGLPPAGGTLPPLAVIFRHYGLAPLARTSLGEECRALVQARGHLFLAAGSPGFPGADGRHGGTAETPGHWTAPAHDAAEIRRRAGADALFVSPVWPSASHEGAGALGLFRGAALARRAAPPVFALGGVDRSSARRLIGLPFYGIGAIGAFGRPRT